MLTFLQTPKCDNVMISVGLPVYNGDQYLEQTLESFLAQTWEKFELIISDNGSTDETEKICRAFLRQDERIQYYRSATNKGAAWNFNHVFQLARGEYFKWAAHDDLVAPTFLERCRDVLEEHPSVILAYPRTAIIDESSEFVQNFDVHLHLGCDRPSERFQHYLNSYYHPQQCHPVFGLTRSGELAKTSLIGNYVSSDRVLLGELALRGKFYEIPEHLFFRRLHPKSSVRAYPEFRDRVIWFDPAKRGKLQMVRWIFLREYLDAIRRVPMSKREKSRCNLLMGQWILRNIQGLGKDALKGILWPILRPVVAKKIKAPET